MYISNLTVRNRVIRLILALGNANRLAASQAAGQLIDMIMERGGSLSINMTLQDVEWRVRLRREHRYEPMAEIWRLPIELEGHEPDYGPLTMRELGHWVSDELLAIV